MNSIELPSIIQGDDATNRCWWCGDDPLYIDYHDHEWGFPVSEDHRLFEKICLEGFQAGLSWITILKKRDAFREAFCDFEFDRVAKFKSRDVTRLLGNQAIVRHRGKIESAIRNAGLARELIDEFGSLATYFWQYRTKKNVVRNSRTEIITMSPESTAMSKDLKKRGWTFVGPTTCFAFMQAMGIVNDHLKDCHLHKKVKQLQKEFHIP